MDNLPSVELLLWRRAAYVVGLLEARPESILNILNIVDTNGLKIALFTWKVRRAPEKTQPRREMDRACRTKWKWEQFDDFCCQLRFE